MPVPTENSPVSDSDLGNHHEPHDVAAAGRPTVCHRPHPSRGAGRANRSWSVSDNHPGNHYSFKSLAPTVLVPWSVALILMLIEIGTSCWMLSCSCRGTACRAPTGLFERRICPNLNAPPYNIFNVLKVKGITLGNRYHTRYCCVFCRSASASAIAALIRHRYVNACGKLPSISFALVSYSSEKRPRSFAV